MLTLRERQIDRAVREILPYWGDDPLDVARDVLKAYGPDGPGHYGFGRFAYEVRVEFEKIAKKDARAIEFVDTDSVYRHVNSASDLNIERKC